MTDFIRGIITGAVATVLLECVICIAILMRHTFKQ
jgi:hypothetical protein